jgi:hypothetical protein
MIDRGNVLPRPVLSARLAIMHRTDALQGEQV